MCRPGGGESGRHLALFGQLIGALGRRAVADAFEPVAHRRVIRQIDALARMRHHPRVGGDIGDAVVVAAQVRVLLQLGFQHAIQPFGFQLVALNGVRHRLRRVVVEVMILPEHRPEPGHLPEQPLQGGGAFAQALAQQFAGLLRQIQQDFTGFEQADRLAAVHRLLIDDRRDFVVGRNAQKVRFELLAGADVYAMDTVG